MGPLNIFFDNQEGKALRELVGSIVIYFSLCEQLASWLVDMAVIDSSTERCGHNAFITEWKSEARIKAYKRILREHNNDINSNKIELVDSWLEGLILIKSDRNKVVHSALLPIGHEQYYQDFVPWGKKELVRKLSSQTELEKIYQNIIQLHSKGMEIFSKLLPKIKKQRL